MTNATNGLAWGAAVPRVHVVDVPLHSSETFHLSPFFDLHIDSTMCDYDGLKRVAEQRAALPHHHAIACGDVCDLVLPPDQRRFRSSVRKAELATRDDFFAAAVDNVVELLRPLGVTWDLISPGNHEDAALKYHGWDATSVISHALGAQRGGYSGVIDYRLHIETRTGTKRSRPTYCRFRVAYHHGAWGGKFAKGYNSAVGWFNSIEGWDVALYGHNHASRVDPELRFSPNPTTGALDERPVWLVNCASWCRSITSDARATHYSELRGYTPQPRQTPLIKVTPQYQTGGMRYTVKVEV